MRYSVRALKDMVEIYAVDHNGLYPEDLAALRAAATRPGANYWQELNKPAPTGFFREFPPGPSLLLMPGEAPRPDSLEYRPLRDKTGRPCGYVIEGYDGGGSKLTEGGKEHLASEPCP